LVTINFWFYFLEVNHTINKRRCETPRACLQVTSDDFWARVPQRFSSTTHAHKVCIRSIRVTTCDNSRIDQTSLRAWVMENRCGVRTRKCFSAVIDLAAFRYSLLVLKIYSIRYVHYRFLVLAVSIETSAVFSCPRPNGIFPLHLRTDKNFEMTLLLKFNKYI